MPLPTTLLCVASASYGASVLLGVLVATRVVDTRGLRWLHHVLYSVTFGLAAATVLVALLYRDLAAALLAPALIAFALIPFIGARGLGHRLVGAAPAPFYLAAFLVLAAR